MRKRIALCMAALVLALLGPGMVLVVSRSFGLTMERERARALGEEAAIARAVALETAANRFDRYEASTLQTRYSSICFGTGSRLQGKRCRRQRSCPNC